MARWFDGIENDAIRGLNYNSVSYEEISAVITAVYCLQEKASRPKKENCCGNCKYAEGVGEWERRCHRHAPQIVAHLQYSWEREKPVWPLVSTSDWCGEYERKGRSVNA